MEDTFKEASKVFKNSTKLTFSWLNNTNRQNVEQGVKEEENQKSIQSNKERIQGNATKISSAKTFIELHEDRITHLEEEVKEHETTLIIQGQLVKKLEGQLQQSEGTVGIKE